MHDEHDPLDRQLGDDARRHSDDMAVDLGVERALTSVTARRSRHRAGPVLLVAATVLALVVGVSQLRPEDDVEVAVDDVTTTVPDPRPAPDTPSAPIALGGARDGADSVGLPITVEPATGLTDGQSVTVTGTGFPPGESIGIVMCTREAARDYGGQGVAACNIGVYGSATSDADGVAVGQFTVRRVVVLNGNEIDCAESEQRCLIGMGMISDYDQSGGALVSFDGSVPLPPRPTAEATPTTGLRDGDEIQITTSYTDGFDVQQCVTDTDRCWYHEGGEVEAWRQFPSYDSATGAPINVDCVIEACELRVQGYASGGSRLSPEPIPLAFDPAGPRREPPAMTVSPGTTVAAGSSIAVTIDSDDAYQISLCSASSVDFYGEDCVVADSPSGGETVLTVFDDPARCAPDGCLLQLQTYTMDDSWLDQAPPLVVEPIRIRLTDV